MRMLAVRLTTHARERLHRVGVDDPEARVHADVAQGLEAGRTALSCPRWAAGDGDRKNTRNAQKRSGKGGRLRWTWDESRTHAYLVDVSTRGVALVITIVEAA